MKDLNSILIALKLPSAILGSFGLIFYLFRLNPVTLMTSSSIEKLLFSKEKRISLSLLNDIIQAIIASIFVTLISWAFHSFAIKHFWIISLIATIILVAGYMFLKFNEVREKYFKELFGHYSKRTRSIIISSFLVFIGSMYLLTSYYLGTSMINRVGYTYAFEGLVFTATSSLIFSIFFLIPVTKTVNKFIDQNYRKLPPVFITDNNNNKWYIYHPIDKTKLLLGNTRVINDATEFLIRDRNEVIHSYTLVKEVDAE